MKSLLSASKIGLGIGAVTVLAITFHYIRRKKHRKNNVVHELKWTHIGTVKEIVLYPIRSSSAVELPSANCDAFGVRKFGFRDRRLVLVTEVDGRIASAGRYPLMLSIGIKIISDECLLLTAPNLEPITLNLHEFRNEQNSRYMKKMRGYNLELIEGKAEQHTWCSKVVLQQESGIKLYLASDPILETSWWHKVPNDLIPIMAMHDKSMKDLNSRLTANNQVHHQQFRGNLLIESGDSVKPFDEDNWLWLKIGDDPNTETIMQYNSPCLRCIIPNIDIVSCKRNPSMEPLRTLKSFRLRSHPKEPEMGIYFDVYRAGILKKGDRVYVHYK